MKDASGDIELGTAHDQYNCVQNLHEHDEVEKSIDLS